jgi:DNA polymerase I-like protein with 3'-5' exonuclease and polymerase domains
MLAAYQSGDCYLAFAKQSGAVPENATKRSHPLERELFKTCILGIQYGMEAESLALRINRPVIDARHLLQRYREIYARCWKWSDNTVDHAVLNGQQYTVFGWVNRVPPKFNHRSLRNFHMQANGAEMLRLACCLGIENGIEICAPVHDAVLICAPLWRLEEDVERMRGFMTKASQIVLGGFELQTEVAQLIKYPSHYSDQRGERMWREVMALL